MSFVVAYALAGAGTLLVVLWVMLYLRYSSQYDVMIAAIDKKQFFLPEIFFIGFGFMDMFKVNLKTEAGRKKEKKIAEIYGEKYAEYYHNCIVGGQITYALTVAPLGLFIGAMTNDMTFAILVVAAAAALIVYLDIEVSSAVERKHDEILSDYPEILSKLTLLVNAGMVIREAWTKVAYTCDRAMYKEMQLTSEEMNNGVSELDALHNFAQRCSVKEIRKFTSILSQNIQKGGSELTMSLRYMNEESWEEKKQRAKRKGETAGTKLMIPLMRGYFRAKGLLEDFAKEERGGAEIIAIILIIVVVIGLAAFFRDGIKEVVTNLMERIKGEAGGFQS